MKKLVANTSFFLPFLITLSLLYYTPLLSQNLLQSSDFQYLGAFKVPLGEVNGTRFGYGGTAPVYNSANHSLYMVGHNHHQMVAEITIPNPINSNNLNDLNRATFLQNFSDASEGLMYTVDDGTILVGGLLLHNSDLIGSAYTYYDADGDQLLSHFVASPDWSVTSEVQGMFELGDLGAGFVSGYMTHIPAEWQDDFGGSAITGNCCIPIISRTSYGPAAFVFDPADLGVENPVPVTPLVYYPSENPLAEWNATSPLFNGSTSITGVVFPENSRSVLFFGRHGTGTFCYGTGEDCNDPVNSSNGTHAYPYIYQVWAYDVLDLLAVKNGTLQAWAVQPYATWELDFPFEEDSKEIGGVAYNPATRQIYVSQQKVEGLDRYPVMHVFELPENNDNSNETPYLCECDPLPAPTNTTVTVSDAAALQAALQQANTNNGDMTILLEDGTYQLNSNLLYINTNMNNLTIRSVSGNRDAVIIRGQGMNGGVTHIFNVAASNFTASDMTIGWVANHAIQIHGENNADNCLIQNIRFVDVNEQMLKVSGSTAVEKSDNGIVQCCSFEFTAGTANQWYTGGIDAHKAQNWQVRYNVFKDIASPEANLSEHAIHFWSDAAGTLVENNLIINCDRGIGFGLGSSGHSGGIIRNNMVHTSRDVGIGLETAPNAKVYHNTVVTENYFNSIEYRFAATTNVHIANNLTTENITSRDGGTGIVENNFETNDMNIFEDAGNYNFHLTGSQTQITDAGMTLAEVSTDYDCEMRPDGNAPDIGADEQSSALAVEVVDFQGEYKNHSVILEWLTAERKNLFSMDIQRSENGVDFYKVKTINAVNGIRQYTFQDKDLPTEMATLYYRLQFNDKQGEVSFFKIISITIPSNKEVRLHIFPNPVQHLLHIRLTEYTQPKANYQIFNSQGQIIFQKEEGISFEKEGGFFQINVSFLPKGLYWLKVNDDESNWVSPFVVK